MTVSAEGTCADGGCSPGVATERTIKKKNIAAKSDHFKRATNFIVFFITDAQSRQCVQHGSEVRKFILLFLFVVTVKESLFKITSRKVPAAQAKCYGKTQHERAENQRKSDKHRVLSQSYFLKTHGNSEYHQQRANG